MMGRYSGLPPWLYPLPWGLLVAYLSLYPALYAVSVSVVASRRGPVSALLTAPVLWTGLEWLRGWVLTGFPWARLGDSQQGSSLISQGASIGGVAGLSFLIASFSAALCIVIIEGAGRRSGRLAIAVIVLVPSLLGLWGAYRLRPEGPAVSSLTLACVQGNNDPDPSLSDAVGILGIYEDLTREAVARGATLVLWPESSVPFGFEMDDAYRAALRRLVVETGAALVIGSIGGPAEGPYANSAFLITPGVGPAKGGMATGDVAPGPAVADGWPRYDKIHLVPYGEYVPLARMTPFVRRFVEAIGEFEAGTGPVVWDIGSARLSPLICYEAIFPPLARRAALSGADVLVNLTNDGWFGTSAGPAQHLALARMRAIETGRPLVRAANTGISAVFDTRGRVLGQLPVGERGVLVARIVPSDETTPYLLMGDALPVACAIISLLLVTMTLLGGSQRPDVTHPRRSATAKRR